jgi:hypothetical protein
MVTVRKHPSHKWLGYFQSAYSSQNFSIGIFGLSRKNFLNSDFFFIFSNSSSTCPRFMVLIFRVNAAKT